MANAGLHKIQQKLEGYRQKIQQYEQELAKNATDNTALETLIKTIKPLLSKLQDTLEAKVTPQPTAILKKTQKQLTQITAAVQDLSEKVTKIEASNKLATYQKKITAHIEKIKTPFPTLETTINNLDPALKEQYQLQLEQQKKALEALELKFSPLTTNPSNVPEQFTTAKAQVQKIRDRVAAIKAQFS